MSVGVLVEVDNVSKRFCRSLKRSLLTGLQNLGSENGGLALRKLTRPPGTTRALALN